VAERTVNVTINYKVNTAEVQKAQAASVAAQKATDQLRKSTEEYGKAVTSANKQAASSTQSVAAEFNNLYTSVKLILTAGIAREVLTISLNMAKLSGQVDGVNRAFQRLPNATLLLNDLRKATHGTVNDLELMQKTLMAQNYKIPLQNLGTLLEFAAVKAQQTGQEVNHLVDFIVTGIGLRSIKRLDDLGFTGARVKEALGGLTLQAASMGQVMEAVTKLMNEDLAKTGGFAQTSKTQVEQLERKWHELNVTVSEFGTQPGLLKFYDFVLTNFTAGVKSIFGASGTVATEQAKAMAVIDVQTTKQRLLTKEILADKQKTFDVIQQEANSRVQIIGRNNDELAQLKERRTEITDSGKMMTYEQSAEVKRLNEQIKYYNFKNLQLKESIRILNEFNESIDTSVAEDSKHLGIVQAKREEIERIQESIETTTDGGLLKRFNQDLEVAQAELKELLSEFSLTTQKALGDKDKGLSLPVNLDLKDPVTGEVKKLDVDNIIKSMEALVNMVPEGKIPPLVMPVVPGIIRDSDFEKALEANKEAIMDLGLQTVQDQLNATMQAEVDAYSERINNLRDFYDEQIMLAGDNERAKKALRLQEEREINELQKRRADKERQAAEASIIVNTALGIVKAIATAVTVYDGFIQAAIVAAQGASQLAIAKKARYYAKGEVNIDGPGNETSDSIPAFLSKGESVINAKATRRSLGLLEAIQANKIDDRILNSIDFSGGRTTQSSMNDERIVAELRAIRDGQYQLEEQGRLLYRVYKDKDGNKQRIRSKSI
jgi:endonuclease III-like uncharacterized protein